MEGYCDNGKDTNSENWKEKDKRVKGQEVVECFERVQTSSSEQREVKRGKTLGKDSRRAEQERKIQRILQLNQFSFSLSCWPPSVFGFMHLGVRPTATQLYEFEHLNKAVERKPGRHV